MFVEGIIYCFSLPNLFLYTEYFSIISIWSFSFPASYHEKKFSNKTKSKGKAKGLKEKIEPRVKVEKPAAVAEVDFADELQEVQAMIERRRKQIEEEKKQEEEGKDGMTHAVLIWMNVYNYEGIVDFSMS